MQRVIKDTNGSAPTFFLSNEFDNELGEGQKVANKTETEKFFKEFPQLAKVNQVWSDGEMVEVTNARGQKVTLKVASVK